MLNLVLFAPEDFFSPSILNSSNIWVNPNFEHFTILGVPNL